MRDRVNEVLDSLQAVELRDESAEFRTAAASVEARTRQRDTLPLHAGGYGRATEMAREIAGREEQPASVRREAGAWLDRDRSWREELATVRSLTGAEGQRADPSERREAAELPAVVEAVRRETGRLAGLPPLEEGIAWTGDEPLIAGDRIAFRADGRDMAGGGGIPGRVRRQCARPTRSGSGWRIPGDGKPPPRAASPKSARRPCWRAAASVPRGRMRGCASWSSPGSAPCRPAPAACPARNPFPATASPGPRPPGREARCARRGRARCPNRGRGGARSRPPGHSRVRPRRARARRPRSGAPPGRSPRAAASAPHGSTRRRRERILRPPERERQGRQQDRDRSQDRGFSM